MNIRLLGVLTLLAACCPVPQGAADTSFRARVTGVAAAEAILELTPNAGAPLELAFTPGLVRSERGEPLALEEIVVGDTLYVRGALRGDVLEARSVVRLP